MLLRIFKKNFNSNLNVFLTGRRNYKFTCVSYNKKLTERKMKFLNVAEKNDAAKNIALHLSRGNSRRREGLSQYNKIYEFDGEVLGQSCQMVMTSVSGHLLALEFVGAFKSWQSCNPLQLFEAPVFKYCPENYEKIKKTLEREVITCDGLIIWTDCDREGENIGFEIIQVCTAVKNNLRIYRAKFSEITGISVRRALANLEQPNKNISDAVDVRQELDLRIGAAFTRFQTLRLQRVFPTKLADSLVSYGSCQFPTLGFVVERYRAVENFVTEPFWKIKVRHTQNELTVEFSWERVRLFDQLACLVLHDMCIESPLATVTNLVTKPKSKWRPLPLDTVELEKQASRKLKINAKETMRIAEKLYTQGLISYPRTETNEYPREMNLAQLVGQQTGDPNWGAFAQGILDQGGPTPRQGNKSDKAHPPIHPTKYSNSLQGNEQRLYEFIVRSFLACCSRDAQGQETVVAVAVAGEKFSASGLVVTHRNYLDVYPYDKWSSKEIHHYEMGQTFNPTSIDMLDGNTSPPNLLTEADLIALMEKHGIGTDATHADHIETIKSRSYVALADAIHFVPGLLGMGLVEGYDAMGLSIAKPDLRANLEQDLKDISEGTKQPAQVLAEQIAIYKNVYETVIAEAEKIDQALGERLSERPTTYTPANNPTADITPVLKCPKCGSDMVIRQKRSNADELYIGCLSFPNCKNALWLPSVVRSMEVLNDTCANCGPNYKKIKFQWRNNSISHLYPPPYEGCLGGCDLTFLEMMKINLSCVKNVPDSSRIQPSVPQGSTNNSVNRTNNTANRTNSLTNITNNRTNNIFGNNPIPTAPRQNLQQPRNVPDPPARTNSQGIPAPRQMAPFTAGNRSQNTSNAMRMPTPSASGSTDDNNVLCTCNQPAILLTVRKQTANFGKKFYKCQQGKENGGCDFFLWAPESADVSTNQNPYDTPASSSWGPSTNASSSSTNVGSSNSTRGWGIAPARDSFPANDDDVNCNCGLPGKKLTVHKEGPNKGRAFYGCPKDFNSRCSFFQWADATGTTNYEWGSGGGGGDGGGGGFGGGGRGGFGGNSRGGFGGNSRGGFGGNSRGGRGRGRGEGSARGGARKCGHCRQEGHTRNKCPNLQAD